MICFMLLLPALMFSAKIGILHLKASGIDDAMADAVAGLVGNELSGHGYQVLNPDAMDAAVGEKIACYESGCAAEAGFTAKVERVIYGSVTRFGDKYIVQLSVVNVSTQEVVWTGSLASATVEDMDMVAKRLGSAIVSGKKPEQTVEVGTVTQQEEEAPRRRQAFLCAGGKFGTLIPLGGYGGSGMLMNMGGMLWYEITNMAIELGYEYCFSGDLDDVGEGKAVEGIMDISVLYFFNKGDFSPFVRGGAGLSMLGLYDDTGSGFDTGMEIGFGATAGVGLAMFRTYDFRLVLDGAYHMSFVDITGFDSPHHGPKISIGVLYKTKRGGCFGGGCGGPGCF